MMGELKVDLILYVVLELYALWVLNEILWQLCMPVLIRIDDMVLHLDQEFLV